MMDLEANMKEQMQIAEEILELWDKCPESGEFTEWQQSELLRNAHRLAELVTTAHEYKYNRNPPAAV